MKLRKKLNVAGMLCFFMSVAAVLIALSLKKRASVGLFEFLAAVLLALSIVLTVTSFVMKKLRRRKRKRVRRSHSHEDRLVMKPYAETEGYQKPEAEKDEEPAESVELTESEGAKDDHVYQIYSIAPRREKGKKKKAK